MQVVVARLMWFNEVCGLDSEWDTKTDDHEENVPRQQNINDIIEFALFELIATLIQDLLGLPPCVNHQHEELARLSHLAASRYKLIEA